MFTDLLCRRRIDPRSGGEPLEEGSPRPLAPLFVARASFCAAHHGIGSEDDQLAQIDIALGAMCPTQRVLYGTYLPSTCYSTIDGEPQMVLRILIADDHPLVIGGMRDALAEAEDMEIVGEANTGPQALSLVARTTPDIVLLDMRLPGLDGLTCLERIRRDHPTVKVIMCSAVTEQAQIDAAFRLGATAYIVKSVKPVDLPSAIRQAHDQSVYQAFGLEAKTGPGDSPSLTEREQTILAAVAGGLSNKAVAEKLWVTEQTVKFHLTNIYRKLGVSNRTAAAQAARERGLIAGPD